MRSPSRERSFDGKVVVVTGAAAGIGRALCLRFGRAGARVAPLDRDAAGLEALVRELAQAGIDAIPAACDVSQPNQCRSALAVIEKRLGGIDVLINNAGITHRSAFTRTDISVYERIMAVNFFGSLHCTKAALDSLLKRKGMIIVISSIAGFSPLLGRSGYSASKHALNGFFETLRCELAGHGVQVMIVCPGFTATSIERNALDGSGGRAGYPESGLGKMASPKQVADAIYRGAASGKRLLVLSPLGRVVRLLSRFAPTTYARAMSRRFRRELDP
ncbi:MAG: SDR family oxidoreductase [Deltaproteobacteria bacterium]|nr:SDR family oxidoreductase [Deltaproteobacteria bacterium]